MSRVFEGKVKATNLPDGEQLTESEIILYDAAGDESLVCELTEVVYVEWDGYPETSWLNAEWFMVEVQDNDFSYFIDTVDMDERTRNAILDRCEGVATGAVDQEGSEIFRSEN